MKRVLFLFVFILMTTFTFSQGLKIGIGGGLSVVTSPSSLTTSINTVGNNVFGGAGFGAEYNIAAKLKLNLPLSPITPVGYLQYHFFNASVSTPAGEFKTSMNILTLGVGGELALIPGPISPYVAADISYNSFMKGTFDTPYGSTTFYGSGSKMGLGLGAGVDLNLMVISLDLNAKYNMLNLLVKDSGEATVGIFTVDLFVFF